MKQFVRYGLVGLASNALAFGAYVLVTAVGAAPKLTAGAVYVVAAAVGFVGNRQLTFAHQGSVWSAGARYVVAHTGGFLLNLGLLALLVDHYDRSHVWSQAFAIVVVAGYLFVVFKFFVFAADEPDAT